MKWFTGRKCEPTMAARSRDCVRKLTRRSQPPRRVLPSYARKHRRAIDPAEQRARGNRTFDEWAGDWLANQGTKVALGKLKQRIADDYGNLLNRYVLPELGALAIADVDALAIDQFMARLSVRKTVSGAPLHPKTMRGTCCAGCSPTPTARMRLRLIPLPRQSFRTTEAAIRLAIMTTSHRTH